MPRQKLYGTTNDSIRSLIIKKHKRRLRDYSLPISILASTLAFTLYVIRNILIVVLQRFSLDSFGSLTYMIAFIGVIAITALVVLSLITSLLATASATPHSRAFTSAIISISLTVLSAIFLSSLTETFLELTTAVLRPLL